MKGGSMIANGIICCEGGGEVGVSGLRCAQPETLQQDTQNSPQHLADSRPRRPEAVEAFPAPLWCDCDELSSKVSLKDVSDLLSPQALS
jgi:hypothetical protein